MANDQNVSIYGTASIKVQNHVSGQSNSVFVYIIEQASHPCILGTEYMKQNNIVLDFRKGATFPGVKKTTKIKCKTTVVINPHSECVVSGLLSDKVQIGMQGICVGHAEMSYKDLLVAKSVVTCSPDRTVQVKLLNPGNEVVYVTKGAILATFELCDNSVDLIPLSCSHVTVNKDQVSDNVTVPTDLFKTNFQLDPELSADDASQVYQCLFDHKSVFITEENPELGFSNLVQHQINLKPDFISKHQRPYRLPPDKKEVLRHQLDELLKQGVITTVSESEEESDATGDNFLFFF